MTQRSVFRDLSSAGIYDPMTSEYILTPVDENAIAFSRTPAMVLDIAYLSGSDMTVGGFFPDGVNVSFLGCMLLHVSLLLCGCLQLPAA